MARTRPAPETIGSAKEAKAAFARIVEYGRLARKANAGFHRYSAGTHTSEQHRERFEEYQTAVDEWTIVLAGWLDRQAASEKA